MRKKIMIVLLLAALAGCTPYLKQDFTSYSFNGKEVKLGMRAGEVSEIAGPPAKVTIPEPVSDIANNTMFANDPAYLYLSRHHSSREYWQYGSFERGDKEQIRMTIVNGKVTKIRKCTLK
ncbi:MAG: hypothetical protein EG826_07545 [Deltaproteobacteria bacterium]|nr:hypothetical protein [Deltaproteobacteria bacterium]